MSLYILVAADKLHFPSHNDELKWVKKIIYTINRDTFFERIYVFMSYSNLLDSQLIQFLCYIRVGFVSWLTLHTIPDGCIHKNGDKVPQPNLFLPNNSQNCFNILNH
jgi:hypothetical protein